MTKVPIHPGEILADELTELKLSANEFARQLGVPTNRITAILRGQRGVTGDTALRLGHWFKNSPEYWMNLQALYELDLAEQRAGARIRQLPTLSDRTSVAASG